MKANALKRQELPLVENGIERPALSFKAGDTLGEYEVLGVLGTGGMGQVYQVRSAISGRIEAMKILLPCVEDESRAAERFTREIQVLAGLNHPNVAALYAARRLEGRLVMITEYLEGVTLAQKLQLGTIHLEEAVGYACQALAALSYAHQRGIVHRDIKPANMMVTSEGTLKLMDFGIAKASGDHSLTNPGAVVGSACYMSPEQIASEGEELDGRSDLYSLGVVLYELATGKRPFHSDNCYTVMAAHVQSTPHPPIKLAPLMPKGLNDAILRALEKQPERRFQTAEEFRLALEPFRGHRNEAGVFSIGPDSGERSPSSPNPRSNPNVPSCKNNSWPERVRGLLARLSPQNRDVLYIFVALLGSGSIVLLMSTGGHTPKPRPKGDLKSGDSNRTPRSPAPFLASPTGDMVLVPGGQALLGANRHPVHVGGFYIDRTEVSNEAYFSFCRNTGHTAPPGAEQRAPGYPVVEVTFDDAQAFCGWAGKRLPKAEEWEKAARGANGQTFPWGNNPDYDHANIPRDAAAANTATLAPVVSYLAGASPYGVLNMGGNAWEWVDAPASAPVGPEFSRYQQIFRALVPPLSAGEPFRYARGGSFRFLPGAGKTAADLISDPGSPLPARAREPDLGFRCAKDVN